jgi:predicted GIY-YIG superfamily endonuclease
MKDDMKTFKQIVDEMPGLLDKLKNQPAFTKAEMSARKIRVPKRGIYVLFEGEEPIYVGRSNKIRQRLSDHCNQSSGRFSATFAFRLAIKDYINKYGEIPKGMRREDLENNQKFALLFKDAKTRVSKMGIKAVDIDDPITQTIFEVYAAMELKTLEFNSFDNH